MKTRKSEESKNNVYVAREGSCFREREREFFGGFCVRTVGASGEH